jgi:hypothetical protein
MARYQTAMIGISEAVLIVIISPFFSLSASTLPSVKELSIFSDQKESPR